MGPPDPPRYLAPSARDCSPQLQCPGAATATNDNPYRFIGCAYAMHIHIRASKTDLRMRACYHVIP